MKRLGNLFPILRRVSLDFPGFTGKWIRLLWERTGNYSEALDVSEKRLLFAFFETTDFCNARCIMCGSKYMKRTRQIMPMETYCTAVEQVAKAKGHSIMLSAFGEPLLDPYIVERTAFANKFGIFRNIGLSTNGSLLTPEMYRMLAEAGLKTISISIDGFQKETYEKVRVGLSFESLQENIVAMLETHDAMGHPINLSVSSFTQEGPKKLKESFLYRQLVEAGIKPGLKWRVDNWGGLISNVNGGLWLMNSHSRYGPCALLYDSSLLVLPDGCVTPCHCRDLEGDLCIGNIKEHSLLEIWRGEILRKVRGEQWEGKFRPPCVRCSAYIPLKLWFTRSMVRWVISYNERVPIENSIGKVNTGIGNNVPGQRVMTVAH